MYILAKKIRDEEGWTLHGISYEDKVAEAWFAADGDVFNIDTDEMITILPQNPIDFDQPDHTEEAE